MIFGVFFSFSIRPLNKFDYNNVNIVDVIKKDKNLYHIFCIVDIIEKIFIVCYNYNFNQNQNFTKLMFVTDTY